MTALESVLRALVADLTACRARFALVGGLAVSVRTEPRFTRDVDLAVAVDSDRQAEELVRALVGRGYRVVAQIEQDAVARFATVRLALPARHASPGIVADLLFASSGIEPELVRNAEPLEVFANLVVPVATTADLIALKVLSRDDRTRPQDLADARKLLESALPEDVEAARSRLALIRERGFHRGKDLSSELERLLN